MSGGSWEYFYMKLEEYAERLLNESCHKRNKLGSLIYDLVEPMKTIEWVDSGDWSQEEETKALENLFSQKDIEGIFKEIKQERKRQDKKWGVQNKVQGDWIAIIGKEYGEVCKAYLEKKDKGYQKELIETAASSVAALECFRRNQEVKKSTQIDKCVAAVAIPGDCKKCGKYSHARSIEDLCPECSRS